MNNPKRTTSNFGVSNNFPAGTNNTYDTYNGYSRSLTNGNTLSVGYGSLPDIMRSQKLAHSINNKLNDLIGNNKINGISDYNDALNLSHSLTNTFNYQAFADEMNQRESSALEPDCVDEFVDINGYIDGVGDDLTFYNWNTQPNQNTDRVSEFVSKSNVYNNDSTCLNCNNVSSTKFDTKNIHKFATSNPYDSGQYFRHHNQVGVCIRSDSKNECHIHSIVSFINICIPIR